MATSHCSTVMWGTELCVAAKVHKQFGLRKKINICD